MKKALAIIGSVIAACLIIVAVYAAYVMFSYYRLDDSLSLTVEQPADGDVKAEAAVPVTSSAGDEGVPRKSAEEGAADEDGDAGGENTAGNAGTLTLVSANLGFGAYDSSFDFFMDGGTKSTAESLDKVTENIDGEINAVKSVDPDFIFFQEVDVDGTRSHHMNEYEHLRAAFNDDASVFAQNYDSAFLMWPLYDPHGANKAGMATFSRFTIQDALRRSLPISDSFSKFLDLDRCYAITRIPASDGRDLVLINVHLSAYGADESIMAAQRTQLFVDMEKELDQGNYVIAGGDFNHDMIGVSNEVYGNKTDVVESWAKPFDFASVPDGFTVASKKQLDEGTFDSAATCRDAGRPYDGTNDRWVMDGFIYSDNITCISNETLDTDFSYSDHNPVVMKFTLDPRSR